MAARVTQVIVEVVVASTSANARVTQLPVEAVVAPTSAAARVTQVAVEAVVSPDAPLRVSQAGAEVIRAGDPDLVVSQAGAEVIRAGDPSLAVSQAGIEVVWRAYQFGNLTANAVIQRTITPDGGLLADAVISARLPDAIVADAAIDPDWYAWSETWSGVVTAGSSFTADACIAKTTQSSFSADAVFKASSGTRTLSADARIQRTFAFTFSAAARIAGWFTADARLVGDYDTITGDFTANAVIKGAGAGSFTADAIARWTVSGSFTADALYGRFTGALTADAAVIRTVEGSFTASAVLRRGWEFSYLTADAQFRLVIEGSFSADARLQKTVVSAFTAAANLWATVSGSLNADAVVVKGLVRADAIVKRTWMTETTALVDPFDRTVASGWGTGPIGAWEDFEPVGLSVSSEVANADTSQSYYLFNDVNVPTVIREYNEWIVSYRVKFAVLPTFGGDSIAYTSLDLYNNPNWDNDVWVQLYYSHISEPAVSRLFFGTMDTVGDWHYSDITIPALSAGQWYTIKIRLDINASVAQAKYWVDGTSEPDWLMSASNVGTSYFTDPGYTVAVGISSRARQGNYPGTPLGNWQYDDVTVSGTTALRANAVIKANSGTKTFTASASIKTVRTGSFVANAFFAMPTYTRYGELFLDAWVLGPWPGSFTADATIALEPFSAGGSFSAAATISQTHRRASFTADAVARRAFSELIFADAVIGDGAPPSDDILLWWDDFNRTVPRGLGTASGGGEWIWTDNDSVSGDPDIANVYVDGSAAVLPSAPVGGSYGGNYESFTGFASPETSGRILFDFWVPSFVATTNGHPDFLIRLRHTSVGVYSTGTDGTWGATMTGIGGNFTVEEFTWYTAEFFYSPLYESEIRVWKRGDPRPEVPLYSGEGWDDDNLPTFIDFYYSAYNNEDFAIDNLYIWEVVGYLVSRSGSFTAAARITLAVPVPGSFLADAYLTKGFFRAYANIGRNYGSVTADAVIKKSYVYIWPIVASASITKGLFRADAVLLQSAIGGSFWANAVIGLPISGVGSFTASASLLVPSFTVDARIGFYFTANAFIKSNAIIYWDDDGVPQYNADRDYKQRIQILVGSIDVTADVVVAETTFSQRARTGAGTFRLTLRTASTLFDGGEYVYVLVDGFRQFGGIVLQVEQSYWFEDKAEPRTMLHGADFNILFDKIFLYSHEPPVTEAAVYPQGITDADLIKRVFAELVDLPAGFDYESGVMNGLSDVPTVVAEDSKWMTNTGQSLRTFMSEVTKITNAVFWIDPYMILQYHTRTAISAPAKITDGRGGISCRDLQIRHDVSNMYNDVIVWGSLAVSTESIQDAYSVRYTDNDNIAAYGLHQFSEVRTDLHTKSHIRKRARAIFDRRNLVLTTGSCTILEPFFQAGQVVNVSAVSMGYEGPLVIHELEMRFPVSYEARDGVFYTTPTYDLQLGLQPDDPWNIYDMLPFDFNFDPHPFFGGMNIELITDPTCPIPMVNGGTGGEMVIGWSASNPGAGSRPWSYTYSTPQQRYIWTGANTPTVTSEYGGAYAGTSGLKFRLWESNPPVEMVVEFCLVKAYSYAYDDDHVGFAVAIGAIDPADFHASRNIVYVTPSGTLYDASDYSEPIRVLGNVSPIASGEHMLLRVLHTGTQSFVKVWKRTEAEPVEWSAVRNDAFPLGGDHIVLSSRFSQGYAYVAGVTASVGFDSIPSQSVVGAGSVDVVVNDFMRIDDLQEGGFDYGYTWAAPPDADLDNYGAPWIGWVNPSPLSNFATANVGAPYCELFCEYKDFTADNTGLVKSINQRAMGVVLPRRNGTQWPTSVLFGGEIIWKRDGANNVPGVPVTFGLTYSHSAGTATPSWYSGASAFGTVFAPAANGDFGVPTTNWQPFRFEVPVNQTIASVPPGGTNPRFYLWCWPPIPAEGSAFSSYVGRMEAFAAGGGDWTNVGFQNFYIALKYGPPVDYYLYEEPQHWCLPESEGANPQATDNEPPIWGWHSEVLLFNEAGYFVLTATPANDFIGVFLDGKLLMPHRDYEFMYGKTYRLSGPAMAKAQSNWVSVGYLVLSTWYLLPPNVSRPVMTDVFPYQSRMPDVRGHL